MSKIQGAFQNGKALMPFLTCGDPDLGTTAQLVRAMAEHGADLIELGIPFSDPTAVSPPIQEANLRALAGGVTTDSVLHLVRTLRQDVDIPLVFTTYANVVFSYGTERFLSACAEIGVDGLSLTDVPYEEREDFLPLCRQYGVDLIATVAPTSGSRVAAIAKEGSGFLYIISGPGRDGADGGIRNDIAALAAQAKANAAIPCVVSCGVSTPEQVAAVARHGDGMAVGSVIVKLVAEYGREAVRPVADYVRKMKQSLEGL